MIDVINGFSIRFRIQGSINSLSEVLAGKNLSMFSLLFFFFMWVKTFIYSVNCENSTFFKVGCSE